MDLRESSQSEKVGYKSLKISIWIWLKEDFSGIKYDTLYASLCTNESLILGGWELGFVEKTTNFRELFESLLNGCEGILTVGRKGDLKDLKISIWIWPSGG